MIKFINEEYKYKLTIVSKYKDFIETQVISEYLTSNYNGWSYLAEYLKSMDMRSMEIMNVYVEEEPNKYLVAYDLVRQARIIENTETPKEYFGKEIM